MARRAFYSFHYALDNWRASQVRNTGIIDGNIPVSDNDWETVKKGGEAAVKKWIDDQLYGRSCTIVLIGANTAMRKWIDYEITESWNAGKGVVGVYVHQLKDSDGNQSPMGLNPFAHIMYRSRNGARMPLSTIVRAYNPPFGISTDAYRHISDQLESWVEEAISIRVQY